MTTPTRFFALRDDRRSSDRWHLGSPVDERGEKLDPWQFKEGEHLELNCTPLFPLAVPGRALDFTLTAFTIPLVTGRVVSLFERLGLLHEVQFLPARVEGHTEPYFILNALRVIRSIDDARCEEVLYWTPEDNRPDKTGEYRNVSGLKVDPALVGDAHIFRPWGWRVVLIVSEPVKLAMEHAGLSGPKFTEA
jgi:hypothetical protein